MPCTSTPNDYPKYWDPPLSDPARHYKDLIAGLTLEISAPNSLCCRPMRAKWQKWFAIARPTR
jgi:hypothetical protein